LLYCAFIGAADEACNIIAEHVVGSVESFVARMNGRAEELGCTDTHFVNTHGRQDAEQYSTAWDLYLIMREATSHPLFMDIAGAYRHRAAATNTHAERALTNSNHIIYENSRYYYRYATGGKVSATYEYGYSAAESAERDGLALVSVVLGAKAVILDDKSTQMQNLTESRRLFEWAFTNFAYVTALNSYIPIAKTPVLYGDGADEVNLRPGESVTVLLPADTEPEAVRLVTRVFAEAAGETLTAPIRAGDVLGEVTVLLNGQEIATVPLVASTDVDLQRIKYARAQILDALGGTVARTIYISLGVLIVAYTIIVIRWNINKQKKLRETREKLARERQQEVADEWDDD
jgi:D-alanyl-D-alanine carboxypeptidase (penicillin-binding protein 5/6)